jgi:hypothetical protein
MSDYTREEAQRDYTPLLRLGQVQEMAERFGLTTWIVRRLIKERAVKRVLYPGRTRAYYHRDEVLRVVLGDEPGDME